MTLILDLKLQEAAASAVYNDDSASNNDATLSTGNTQDIDTTGPGGTLTKAAHAADGGIGSHAVLATQVDLTADFGIGFFLKQDNSSNTTFVLLKDDINGVVVDQGTLTIDFQWTKQLTGVTTTDYHHYFIQRSSGTLSLYVDGELLATSASGSFAGTLSLKHVFGSPDLSAAPASIAGIKIYNATRTQPEIAADSAEGGIGGGGVVPTANYYRLLLAGCN